MAYMAKSELVQGRQLKVQKLEIPFTITGNATPASVVVVVDEPSIMFVKTQGTDKITVAAGALDSGEAVPTFVAQNDGTGLFSVLIKVSEQIDKVCYARIVKRNSHTGADTAKIANTTGISANGDKIALDCDTSVDLSAASLNACLEIAYIVKES